MRRVLTLGSVGIVAVALLLGHAAPSPGAAQPQHVTVHSGDTLWGIATEHYPGEDPRGAIERIQDANGLTGAELATGQELVLP